MSGRENSAAEALQGLHSVLLEALRHREQDIFSYLAILVPAFGGFAWLLVQNTQDDKRAAFIFGTLGTLLILFMGAAYSLSLGYNFRYITFQLAKIEESLGLRPVVLQGWPRNPEAFRRYTRWCEPPEIIKIFWYAFLLAILLVTTIAVASLCASKVSPKGYAIAIVLLAGLVCLLAGVLGPLYVGRKFKRLWAKETEPWQRIN